MPYSSKRHTLSDKIRIGYTSNDVLQLRYDHLELLTLNRK